MQAAHMLLLLSTTYDVQFDNGAREAMKPRVRVVAGDTAVQALFRHHWEQIQTKPQSHQQHKDHMFEWVAQLFTGLVESVTKNLSSGVNKCVVKIPPRDAATWPEEFAILGDLFHRYINVTLKDPLCEKRDLEKIDVSLKWDRKDHKLLSDLLGVARPNKGSKTNNFRQNDTFCDCVVIVEGKEFPVHKLQLAKKSCYFEAMLDGNFRETYQRQPIVLDDPTLTADLFETILEHIYTGSTNLSGKSAKDLILLAEKAKMFLLPKLELLCNRLLLTKIDAATWPEIATHALNIEDGGILKEHCEYLLQSTKISERLLKELEKATLEDLCEYYEHSNGYKLLHPHRHMIETRIREALSKDTLKEICEFGSKMRSSSLSRKFLEQECRAYIEAHQEWLNEEANAAVKDSYIKLLTGL